MVVRGVGKPVVLTGLVLWVVLAAANPVFAFEKTGTTAATFLQIPVGARIPAMGSAGVALPGGPELLPSNPAASFSAGDGIGIALSDVDWIAGLRHQAASLLVPTTPTFALGLNVVSFGGGEFEQTTLSSQEGNGIMVDYGDVSVGVTAVARLTDRFTVGVTGNYIHQALFNESASTVAFDVGTMLLTSLQGFSIGMAMTHLGGEMQLEGRDLLVEPGGVSGGGTQYETSAWPLPLTFQTGVAWRMLGTGYAWQQSRMQSLILVADARHVNEGITTLHVGGEYGIWDSVFLRAGRTIGHDTEQWAFGGGVRVNLYGYSVRADLAYADLGDLDAVQRITITLMQNRR